MVVMVVEGRGILLLLLLHLLLPLLLLLLLNLLLSLPEILKRDGYILTRFICFATFKKEVCRRRERDTGKKPL